jgi:preprotein translocase subunit YajC
MQMNQVFTFIISTFFISTASAQTAAVPAPQGGGFSFMIMFVVFFLFIYFAIWRPQNKRAKEQQNLLNSLAKGDEVVTAGGLLGRINKINDQYLTLSIANNVDIVIQKSSVISVMPKGTLKAIE